MFLAMLQPFLLLLLIFFGRGEFVFFLFEKAWSVCLMLFVFGSIMISIFTAT